MIPHVIFSCYFFMVMVPGVDRLCLIPFSCLHKNLNNYNTSYVCRSREIKKYFASQGEEYISNGFSR